MGGPIYREVERGLARSEKEQRAKAASRLMPRTCMRHSNQYIHGGGSTTLARSQPSKSKLSQEIQEQMLLKGWCIHQVRSLAQKHDIAALQLLASLDRSAVRTVNHERCRKSGSCVAYNTNKTTYKTRHITDLCTCATIAVPYASLLEVVRNGGVPLISIEDAEVGEQVELYLQVVARTSKSSYVAISHVWADGLGNPHINGIPTCQVRRIQSSLSTLQENQTRMLLWMDTLCIPVNDEDERYQRAQIDNMASIYKGASYSLLFDAELLNTAYRESRQNVHVFLASSIWMTRSWTLQEGQLPPYIAIQFSDTMVVVGRASESDGKYITRQITLSNDTADDGQTSGQALVLCSANCPLLIDDSVHHDSGDTSATAMRKPPRCDCGDIALERAFYDIFFAEYHSSSMSQRFTSVWDELSGRSTTKPEDVLMIITNMLDLSNHGLLDLANSSEMFQAIILSLGRVPVSIFFNAGPRKDPKSHHQNRWVPTEVGSFGLNRTQTSLSIQKDYLDLEYSDKSQQQDILAYSFESVVPLETETRICLGSTDEVYYVKPHVAREDRFERSKYVSTILIVESPKSNILDNVLMGPCFFVHRPGRCSHTGACTEHCSLLTRKVQNSPLEMVYYCALELRKYPASPTNERDESPAYRFVSFERPSKFQVKYDQIPGFKRLQRRSRYGYHNQILRKFVIAAFLVIAGSFYELVLIGTVMKWLLVPDALRAAWMALASCIWILLLPATLYIAIAIGRGLLFVDVASRLEEWHHVRSFEVRRRSGTDVV